MLLSQTFQLIRSEKLLLAPYIFLMMIVQLSESYFPTLFTRKLNLSLYMILVFVAGWAVELIFKQITIKLSLNLILPKRDLKDQTMNPIVQYLKLLAGSIIFMIPIGVVLTLLPKVSDQSSLYHALLTFIVVLTGFSIVMILAIILSIYPIVVMHTPKENFFTGLYKSLLFVKTFFKECILFLSLTISILFFSMFLTLAAKNIPLLGPMVLPVFIQGIGYAYIYVMSVLFYLSLLPYLTLFSPTFSELKEMKDIKESQGEPQ